MTRRPAALAFSLLCIMSLLFLPSVSRGQARHSIAREYRVPALSAKDGQPLTLYAYEKYAVNSDPAALAAQGRIVLVLPGATTSGRVNFDVQVPGVAFNQSFSLMDQFARRGYDVWTMDYQNYGRSDKHDCGLCVTTEAAARDVEAVVRFILTLRKTPHIHLIGWSWGGQVAGVFAEHNAGLVNRLVLYAPPTESGPGAQVSEHFRTNSGPGLVRLFHPTGRVSEAVDAWVREALRTDARSPNGVLADLGGNPMKFSPSGITMPTLMVYGAEDPLAPPAAGSAVLLFRTLGTADRKFVIIPGAGHGLYMERMRGRWYQEVLLHLELGTVAPRPEAVLSP